MGSSAGCARWTAAGPALAGLLVLLSCGDAKVVDARGELTASPVELDFGAVFLGDRIARDVELRSNGRLPVTVGASSAPAGFSLEPATVEVAAGGAARVRVVFAPAAAGEAGGTLTLGDGDTVVELEVRGTAVERRLEVPTTLDFGPVVLGESAEDTVRVANRSALPVVLEASMEGPGADAFRPAREPLELPADGVAELAVRFTPHERGAVAATLVLASCDGCQPVRVQLLGEGLLERFGMDPTALDFGTVLTGTSRTLEAQLVNQGDVPREVRSLRVLPATAAAFSVEAGSLPITVQPGGRVGLAVRFAPSTEGPQAGTVQALDDRGEVLAQLSLAGSGQALAIGVEPAALDFGARPVVTSSERAVWVTVTGGSTQLESVAIEGSGAAAFRADPTRVLPTTVGAPLDVKVTFFPLAAGRYDAVLVLRTSDAFQPELRVPLAGTGTVVLPCRIDVQPTTLPFGLVPVGSTNRGAVTVTGAGGECRLTEVGLDGAGPFTLAPVPEPVVIPPGSSRELEVTYAPTAPTAAQPDRATLRFKSNDSSRPYLAIAVTGAAVVGDLRALPGTIDFGDVTSGHVAFRTLELRNAGSTPLRLVGVAFANGSSAELQVRSAPTIPVLLAPGTGVPVVLSLAASAASPFAEGVLEVAVEGAALPKRVEVRGHAVAGECGAACHAPAAVCPGRVVTEVTKLVRLAGSGLDPDGDAVTCRWTLTGKPTGSTVTPTVSLPCGASLTADLVGDYDLELVVTDPTGYQGRCTTQVHANPYSGLWLETFWDRDADVDLHLLHPTHHPGIDPFDAWSWNGPDGADCYYYNCRPTSAGLSWPDSAGPEDDPHLDVDSQHYGPENTRIDVPNRTHPYWIGVHWLYNTLSHPNVRVTTNVYCGGVLATSQTVTLLHREHVVLGKVDVNPDGTCTFTASGFRLSY